ncbi:hypothetical protein FGU71_04040 [Erythrobacter insulae]|uniref:YCII-related domain-containing protein n=1 Tax=Erythrobacter insulae TaxID=2584124 RepID=A0A547PAC6_9SPHN|nr:YciI family protein [Erythrobacter insulae]TRD11102.1 hypothetical protein FGU71_04040 [Erythrobacter insulae]
MKLYAFHCRDGEHGGVLRERIRAEHLAYIDTQIGKYAVAGPLKDGDMPIGSLLVIKGETEDEARAVFEGDPYFTAGVWQSIRVSEFVGLFGDWIDSET